MQKGAKQDRSALFDITNDSPIVGLAMGSLKTPSSGLWKTGLSNKGRFTGTPGSGEALLRGQVKTLLQKVEEEAVIALEKRPFFDLDAPTPANTPQLFNLGGDCDFLPQVCLFINSFFNGHEMVDLVLMFLMCCFVREEDEWCS